MSQLAFTTKAAFEELMTEDGVVVKSSYAGPEYITALYRGDQLIGERVLHVSQADHFIVRPEQPVSIIKPKTTRFPQ